MVIFFSTDDKLRLPRWYVSSCRVCEFRIIAQTVKIKSLVSANGVEKKHNKIRDDRLSNLFMKRLHVFYEIIWSIFFLNEQHFLRSKLIKKNCFRPRSNSDWNRATFVLYRMIEINIYWTFFTTMNIENGHKLVYICINVYLYVSAN